MSLSIGSRIYVKGEPDIHTITGFVSDVGYTTEYTVISNGKAVVMTMYVPVGLAMPI